VQLFIGGVLRELLSYRLRVKALSHKEVALETQDTDDLRRQHVIEDPDRL
jgi:hypothetical protein